MMYVSGAVLTYKFGHICVKFGLYLPISLAISVSSLGRTYLQVWPYLCQVWAVLYFIMILLSIYIYNWIGNKFLQLTSPSPYKYINSINKTNQMTANVQAISIIISKLSKIMSN